MRPLLPGLVLLAAVLAAVPARPGPPRVEAARPPEGAIQPQAVTDADGGVHLVAFRGETRGGDLYYYRRAPGQGWSEPIRVNSRPGDAVAAGTIRGGQLALGRRGRVHVVWFGAGPPGGGHGGARLQYARLNDAGRAFEAGRNLMGGTRMLDGGPSVAADAEGRVWVVWHAGDGQSEAEGARRLWIARSTDDGRTFAPEAPAWGDPTGACACCSVKAFADRRGQLFILYRSAQEKVHRDMYLLTSTDHGATFRGERVDRWQVPTCPMSSEAFAEGPRGVVAAWETAGQVYLARVGPGTAAPRATVAPGSGPNRKHPALAINGAGEMLLAWTEGTAFNRGGDLAWQVFDADGRPMGARGKIAGGVPVWGLPSAVARPDGTFLLLH